MSYILKNRLLVLLILISSPLFGMTAKLGFVQKLRSRIASSSLHTSHYRRLKTSTTVSLSKTRTSKKSITPITKLESIVSILGDSCLLPSELIKNIIATYLPIEDFDHRLASTMLAFKNPLNHEKWIDMAKFDKNCNHAITASGNTANIWNIATEKATHIFPHTYPSVLKSAELSKDGLYMLTIGFRSGVALWEVQTGNCIYDNKYTAYAAEFSPNGKYIIINDDNACILWDIELKKEIGCFQYNWKKRNKVTLDNGHFITAPEPYRETLVKMSPDNKYIIITHEKYANIWNIENNERKPLFPTQEIRSVEWSNDSNHVLMVYANNTAKVWDLKTLKSLSLKDTSISSAYISNNSNSIITIGTQNTLNIVDIKTGCPISTINCDSKVESAQLSNNYQYLITIQENNTFTVWDTETCKALYTRSRKPSLNFLAQFNSDDSCIISATSYDITIWDAKTGALLDKVIFTNISPTILGINQNGTMVIGKTLENAFIFASALIELNYDQLLLLSRIQVYSHERSRTVTMQELAQKYKLDSEKLQTSQLILLERIQSALNKRDKAFSLEELAKAYKLNPNNVKTTWLTLTEDMRAKISKLYNLKQEKALRRD